MTQQEAEKILELVPVPKGNGFKFWPGDLVLTNTLELVFVREVAERGVFSVSSHFFEEHNTGKTAWWYPDEVISWKPSALRQILES